ncbi:MAG: M24 family metallopeptidase [Polyangiaceae bacterium]
MRHRGQNNRHPNEAPRAPLVKRPPDLPDRRCLLTNVIEAPRLEHEHGMVAQGWELVVSPWHEGDGAVARLTHGLRLGADGAYRHVLPTDRRLERYLFLSFCGRRAGLVCSLTRSLYFGRVPQDLLARQRIGASVDAVLLSATRPGAAVRDVFQAGADRYAASGFADQWRLHHQGGAGGYETREYLASPTSTDVVTMGHVFAWNPSVPGAKNEDTIAVAAAENEILTETAGWPTIPVEAGDRTWRRPAIREVG